MSLDKVLSIFEKLISFDTTSHLSNLACIDYIEDYLKGFGISSFRLPNPEKTKASLIATIGDNNKSGGVVFSGHTDVVPVKDQLWATDPFALAFKPEEDRFYGRGTCDMKGFIACVLAMVPYIQLHARIPFHLAFSYDEEVGCLAAPQIANFLSTQSWKPSLVVVGEPTEMEVIDAHKSCSSFITQVTGLEGHSSKPHLGVNAVMIAAELIHILNRMTQDYRQPEYVNDHFDPPFTSIHVGKISGGTARNIIPNKCEFAWEIRSLPKQNVQEIIERINQESEKLIAPMRNIFPDANIVTTQLTRVPGLRPEENTCRHHVLHSAGKNSAHAVSFATEAGFFQNQGFATLICGPGNIEQAHKANEFVTGKQLSICIEFIERLVKNYN